MFATVFAFLHLGALVGLLVYAAYSLVRGQIARAVVILILLVAYYAFVLHPAVLKEIARRKSLRKKP